MVILIIIICIFLLLFLAGIHSRKVQLADKIRLLDEDWGNLNEKSYAPQDYECIAGYFNLSKDEGYVVDDITWNDLDMDAVYKRLDKCTSSVGREYLYKTLRRPELQKEKVEAVGKTADWLEKNKSARDFLRLKISKLGYLHGVSFADHADKVSEMPVFNIAPSILMIIINILCILYMIFISAGIGVIILAVSLLITIGIYFKKRPEIEAYLSVLSQISAMTGTGAEISKGFKNIKECPSGLEAAIDSIDRESKVLKKYTKGSWLISAAGSAGSIVEVIMAYVRMITHVDLIHYNSAAKGFRGKEKDIFALMDGIGFIELAMCAASFRKAVKSWCEPEFTRDFSENGDCLTSGNYLTVKDVYHPLLDSPVANTIEDAGRVLITGSNASGKSTFLKAVALNAILAQTLYTACASFYKAPLYRVYSSMALRDNYTSHESYYMVEIKALKRIIDETKKPQPVLALVDEVLKGTNTVERISASAEILSFLAKKGAVVFAATHDIELTDLLKKSYVNYHFKETIVDDDIRFTYRLCEGPSRTRNAIALLKMMGYDDSITENAEKRAERFTLTGEWS